MEKYSTTDLYGCQDVYMWYWKTCNFPGEGSSTSEGCLRIMEIYCLVRVLTLLPFLCCLTPQQGHRDCSLLVSPFNTNLQAGTQLHTLGTWKECVLEAPPLSSLTGSAIPLSLPIAVPDQRACTCCSLATGFLEQGYSTKYTSCS